MRILIIGHARHGKDTLAEMLLKHYGLWFESSSMAASRIFLYKLLKGKYGYKTPEECYADRENRRVEWFQHISEYNSEDKARLAKGILKHSDVYVGMRSKDEIDECKAQGLFDFVIGVYNPRKPLEAADSFQIDLWEHSDFVIPNAGTKEDLENKVIALKKFFL